MFWCYSHNHTWFLEQNPCTFSKIMFFKICVFLGFQPMERSKNIMFEHDVFWSFHRLKPEEYAYFKKHYFRKSMWLFFEKICTIITIPSKSVPVFEKMRISIKILIFSKTGACFDAMVIIIHVFSNNYNTGFQKSCFSKSSYFSGFNR